MNKVKQIDSIRERNKILNQQVRDLEFKIDFDTQLNKEGYKQAKDLISDLKRIKSEWLSVVKDLEQQQTQYAILISEMKEIQNAMSMFGVKIPWYIRLKNMFKRLFLK